MKAVARPSSGFTLLELLVAVALFAIASALAYGGLRAIVKAQEQEVAFKSRLARLQFAMGLLERDVSSAARRGIRDGYGVPHPAFEGEGQKLELTRHGLGNALALPRAEMERVAWVKRDSRLLRVRWPVLDRAPGTKPIEDELLDGVDRIEWVYLDARGKPLRQWPPTQTDAQVFPRAVELTLDVQGFGELRRVLELPLEPPP